MGQSRERKISETEQLIIDRNNMPDADTYRDCTRIIFLCMAWYSVSATNNVVGKMLLNDFPYPVTVTMIQLLSISFYLPPILKCQNFKDTTRHISWSYWWKMILPLGLGKFFASVSSHISIWKVPVSYAHTVKATMPFFVVVLSRVLLREQQTTKVYLSLVPIIAGVVIATVTELSFNSIGLVSALSAALTFSLQSIYTKKCLKDTQLHHLYLLMVLARLATLLFIPLWLMLDIRVILTDHTFVHSPNWTRTFVLLLVDGFCNFAQNVIAFSVLALVTPLSYAVANATKRIMIITVSLMLLQNPVTSVNVMGMFLAIFGVLLYNKAKYDQNQERKRQEVLPYVKSEADFNKLNHMHLHRSNSIAFSSEDHVTVVPNNNLPLGATPEEEYHRPTFYQNGDLKRLHET
ncbi:solute carrier family 35 member E1 homolog isoform X2 [Lineus longissimus]|uniref:solute carrier family 35 member E1 homolog isoform X2 n=1 Tax=Lineus longissimus TaxID=88925 RepID=UPI00315CE588